MFFGSSSSLKTVYWYILLKVLQFQHSKEMFSKCFPLAFETIRRKANHAFYNRIVFVFSSHCLLLFQLCPLCAYINRYQAFAVWNNQNPGTHKRYHSTNQVSLFKHCTYSDTIPVCLIVDSDRVRSLAFVVLCTNKRYENVELGTSDTEISWESFQKIWKWLNFRKANDSTENFSVE